MLVCIWLSSLWLHRQGVAEKYPEEVLGEGMRSESVLTA